MKLYTFTNENGEIIEQVRAEDHSDAVSKANSWKTEGEMVTSDTGFYSEEV